MTWWMVDEQSVALAFALAGQKPTDDGLPVATENVATGFIDYYDDETAYAEDYMNEHGAPGAGSAARFDC